MASRQMTAAVSNQLIALEGGMILFAYDDAVFPTRPVRKGEKIRGTITIGVGHTGPDVYVGMVITEAQGARLYDQDNDIAEEAVSRLVKVPLSDWQFGALVAFVFNVGVGAFSTSTLLKKINVGDFAAVPDQLRRWVHTKIDGKSVVSAGLRVRREKEITIWLGRTPSPVGQNVNTAPVGTTKPTSPVTGPATSAGVGAAAGAAVLGSGLPLWLALLMALVIAGAAAFFFIRLQRAQNG